MFSTERLTVSSTYVAQAFVVRDLRGSRRGRRNRCAHRGDEDLDGEHRRGASGQAMSKGDVIVERGATLLEELSRKVAADGGFAAKLAEPLADDADFLRKLKPSLVAARLRGEAPADGHRTARTVASAPLPPMPDEKPA